MQLLVCGSRDLRDRWIVEAILGAFYWEGITDRTGKLTLYEGGQKKSATNGAGGGRAYMGADYFAAQWAEYKMKQLTGRGMPPPTSFEHIQTVAEWEKFDRVGKRNAAGFIRNQRQLDKLLERWRPGPPFEEKAVALGFVNKPRVESAGTDHMLTLCERERIPTFVIDTTKGFWHVQGEARDSSEQ